MASRTQVLLLDDLDGETADETVEFAIDGASYAIDLSAKNAENLREALSTYVGHARRVGGRTRTRATSGGASTNSTRRRDDRSAQIREWARSQGHKVSDRGRIPADLAAKYDAAH